MVLVSLTFPKINFPITECLTSSLLSRIVSRTMKQYFYSNLATYQGNTDSRIAVIPPVLQLELRRTLTTTTTQGREFPILMERQERRAAALRLKSEAVTPYDDYSCED